MDPLERVETGRQLAVRMAATFPAQDWIAEISQKSGHSRDSVEWHLQEEMVPPAAIMVAVGDMLSAASSAGVPNDQ